MYASFWELLGEYGKRKLKGGFSLGRESRKVF